MGEDSENSEKEKSTSRVRIKFGDLQLEVIRIDGNKAKQDALELFDMLEWKYHKRWNSPPTGYR